MRQSIIQQRGAVSFPRNRGERHYMVGFFQGLGLPRRLAHWQPTVDAMLEGIQTDNPIYLMVDQGFVEAGKPQRRPGLHIDGYWDDGHSSYNKIASHRSTGSHVPDRRRQQGHNYWPSHAPYPRHGSRADSWSTADYTSPEAIILASDVSACQALDGEYCGIIGDMGDCSAVSWDGQMVKLKENTVYAGNVCMLHESLPVEAACWRTLVRLNVPGWTP